MSKSRAKSRLKPTIKNELLRSEGKMGQLADAIGTHQYTVKRQIVSESPILCQPHYLTAIKKILDINYSELDMVEVYNVNEPSEISE